MLWRLWLFTNENLFGVARLCLDGAAITYVGFYFDLGVIFFFSESSTSS